MAREGSAVAPYAGMVVALVFFLSITGLLLVLFGGKAPTPMPYPVWNSYRLPEFVKVRPTVRFSFAHLSDASTSPPCTR